MIVRRAPWEHLQTEAASCAATESRLASRVQLAESEAKARFNRDLLDSLRERRRWLEEKVAELRSAFDRAWHNDRPA